MLLFIAVQYNDPDGAMWMVIYAVPALWAAFAAFGQKLLLRALPTTLLLLSIAASAAGTVYYWPKSSRWWDVDVWFNTETAREGMGMMIVTIVLLIVWFSAHRLRKRQNSMA